MKTAICGKLEVEIQPDGFTAKVVRPFVVMVKGKLIKVNSGWVTDWASIPRFFWRVLPPMGKHTVAAVVHDYLYQFRLGTRSYADKVFLELMKAQGVVLWKRQLMYWAVRLFGGRAWRT